MWHNFFKFFLPILLFFLAWSYGQSKLDISPPLPILNQNITKYKGKKYSFGYIGVRDIISPHLIRSRINGEICILKCPNHVFKENESISVVAIYRGFSFLEVDRYIRHPYRFLKVQVGFLGTFFFFLITVFFFWKKKAVFYKQFLEILKR